MAQINVRIDDNLKKEADYLLNELGLNITTAINIFMRQTVRQGGIPFKITVNTDPFYSESNMEVLKQSIKDADEGKLTKHELVEV